MYGGEELSAFEPYGIHGSSYMNFEDFPIETSTTVMRVNTPNPYKDMAWKADTDLESACLESLKWLDLEGTEANSKFVTPRSILEEYTDVSEQK